MIKLVEGNDPANSFHSHVSFRLNPVLLSAYGFHGIYSSLHSVRKATG